MATGGLVGVAVSHLRLLGVRSPSHPAFSASSDSPESENDEHVPGTRLFNTDLRPSGPPRLLRRLGSSSPCVNRLDDAPEPLRKVWAGAGPTAPCVGVPSLKGTHGGWKASCRSRPGSDAAFRASAQSATAAHSSASRKLIRGSQSQGWLIGIRPVTLLQDRTQRRILHRRNDLRSLPWFA